MVTGAHVILYSKDAERDRDFFRDVLKLPHVDAGHGWLIFGLPPSEVAVHPADDSELHALYLLCDDVRDFIASMKVKGIQCNAVEEQRWGSLTHLTLPGGGKLGVYQPKHPRPPPAASP
ncbi:MAG: VOC family protein [Myxococcaceae bacterium]